MNFTRTELPKELPKEAYSLRCNDTPLTSLKYCLNVKELHLSNNKIESLEFIPNGVINLVINGNKLNSFKFVNSKLVTLHSESNGGITSLEHLPNTLNFISVIDCNIDSLKYCPINIKELYIDKNKIKSLEHLPSGLTYLSCTENEITSLEHLPDGITELSLGGNPIHKVFSKYDQIGTDHNVIYLIKTLKVNSDIHSASDVNRILELGEPTIIKEIIDSIGFNLETNSVDEIIETIKPLL